MPNKESHLQRTLREGPRGLEPVARDWTFQEARPDLLVSSRKSPFLGVGIEEAKVIDRAIRHAASPLVSSLLCSRYPELLQSPAEIFHQGGLFHNQSKPKSHPTRDGMLLP